MLKWLFALLIVVVPGTPMAQTTTPSSVTPSYVTRDLRIPTPTPGVELAATLTLPAGSGPFPAVVLITGAGPQDRDETVAGHKPFAVLADHLSRNGVAVLRYDDRGVGQSFGDFASATLHDFAIDARAALEVLRSHPGVDPARTGLLGHSEGGLVAPIVALAAPRGDVGFLVLMASPGVVGEQTYYLQDAAEARVAGVDEAAIERTRYRKQQMFAVLMAEPDHARAADRLREVMRGFELSAEERAEIAAQGVDLDRVIDQQIWLLNTDAQRVFLTYDPLPPLRRLTIPVFALYGERDLQVPPGPNLPPVQNAFEDQACASTAVRVLPGLNHLFQTAEPVFLATIRGSPRPCHPWRWTP